MSSITAYETSKGKKCYQVRYRKPDGSTTRKAGFATKKAAEIWSAKTEIDKNSNEYIDASKGKIQLSKIADSWFQAQKIKLKPSTHRVNLSCWENHIEEVFATRNINDIKHSEIQTFISKLAHARSATLTLRAHGVLSGIFEMAIRENRIAQNPAKGCALPRKKAKKHIYLTYAQVEALARESKEHATLIRLLAYIGLRWGEATGLKVKNFNQEKKRLLIEENAVDVGGTIVVGTPKSHKKRVVPLPDFLVSELAEYCKGKKSSELIFTSVNGGFLRFPAHNGGWYVYAKIRAGLPSEMTLHDLRHTAASLSVQAGANVKVIQRMLGHSSAAMTLDVYADLFDDDLDEVATKIDTARASVLADKN